jgi:hypothetical protein
VKNVIGNPKGEAIQYSDFSGLLQAVAFAMTTAID